MSIFLTTTNMMDLVIQHTKNLFTSIVKDPVSNLIAPLLEIVFVIILTYVAVKLLDRVVDHTFKWSKVETNKAHTLRKLIKSVVHYTLYFIALLTVLSKFGINLGPVLAGAGILGLAIGFGAQSLVKDVITGFFLIFERQLEVGDIVEINGLIRGTVEEVGLRITKIREYNQRLHYLANGTITQVTNYNREKMRSIVPITVPYESNLDVVSKALEEVVEKIGVKFKDHLVEQPEVVGVTNIDQNGVQFTITALSDPDEYWNLEREMRKESVLVLRQHNIHIAYPRSVLYSPEQINELQSSQKVTAGK
ncbi:mechanosensitive ion channel family protein [Shimazuella sp. AN120528]|uniref:mechanosensitive ion channel family protein n=1 Tax=Shimazuella soli TaxID=1892854 RepID=UPI001F0CF6C9|nr:mechanosensitive ion channel family protein [Shimazuella soli]MCH5586590.1 mechanosensitive ion channel family protein [Shimazuella soli]